MAGDRELPGQHDPSLSQVAQNVGGHNIQIGSAAGDVVILLEREGYRLESLRPVSTELGLSDVPRSQQTSAGFLLHPQWQVVPYRPRSAEERTLGNWLRGSDDRLSVLLLSGPGGQGKTRLASHFASDAHSAEWSVVQAVEQSPRLRPGVQNQKALGGKQLLVVVDYAERWDVEVLVGMVQNLRPDHPDRQVRVLLLARPQAQWWDTLAAELDGISVDRHKPLELGDFTDLNGRIEAFNTALTSFADRLQIPSLNVPVPVDLADEAYGSPLTLHMAALAAASAHRDGEQPPLAGQLSEYLLGHERRYWSAAAKRKSARVTNSVLERVVFIATLVGPISSRAAGAELLFGVHLVDGLAHAGRMLDVHDGLYPQMVSHWKASLKTLTPLGPDRLGEDFVGSFLSRELHSAELLAALVADADGTALLDPLALRSLLIRLAAAGARHEAARTALFEVLRRRPQLAQLATAAVISLLIDHAPRELLVTVEAALPRFSTDLMRSSLHLARHLLDTLPPDATAERASRLNTLGLRLSEVGDQRAALESTREAVAIRRQLAEAEPAAYLPDLAMALNNLGNRLSEVGDTRAALDSTREAVAIRRRLAEAEPAAYLPDLAGALNNLGLRLSEVGDQRAALDSAREAVAIHRRLAEAEPAAYLPGLAMALNNLGLWLSKVGDQRAALDSAREATGLYRQLAEAEPAAYLPDLAMALNNLGLWLSKVGDQWAALDSTREATDLYRRLAEAEPDAYLPKLATALNNLGSLLSEVGLHQEADEIQEELQKVMARCYPT